jgi:hypothetical protein
MNDKPFAPGFPPLSKLIKLNFDDMMKEFKKYIPAIQKWRESLKSKKGEKFDVHFLKPPFRYTYLRESEYHSCSSRFPEKKIVSPRFGILVGYQLLEHTGPRIFHFRYWFLRKHDRDFDPNGVYKYLAPCESVIPGSISADKASIPYMNNWETQS